MVTGMRTVPVSQQCIYCCEDVLIRSEHAELRALRVTRRSSTVTSAMVETG